MRDPMKFFTPEEMAVVLGLEGPQLNFLISYLNSRVRERVGPKVFGVAGQWSEKDHYEMDTHEAHLFCVRKLEGGE